jgi:hypothetical protein
VLEASAKKMNNDSFREQPCESRRTDTGALSELVVEEIRTAETDQITPVVEGKSNARNRAAPALPLRQDPQSHTPYFANRLK